MANFALLEISASGSSVKFYKLVSNGRCLFDKFRKECEKSQYRKNLADADAIIDSLSRGEIVPPKKHSKLKHRDKNDNIEDFEIRCGRVRVYYFIDPQNGSIVVLGNIKEEKEQKSDIRTLRRLKHEYINSKT